MVVVGEVKMMCMCVCGGGSCPHTCYQRAHRKQTEKKISTKFGIVSLNQSLLKTRKIQRKIDRFSQQTIIVHKLPCDVKQPALSLRCASLKYETFFR